MVKRIQIVIVLYIICILLIFINKPALMFDAKGDIKHFNYDENDPSATLMNVEIVNCVLAIFCYFIVISVELII